MSAVAASSGALNVVASRKRRLCPQRALQTRRARLTTPLAPVRTVAVLPWLVFPLYVLASATAGSAAKTSTATAAASVLGMSHHLPVHRVWHTAPPPFAML